MQHDHQPSGAGGSASTDRLRIVSRYVFFGFVAIAAYFLITEHRAHLFGILPFLLLAACPLIHLFHHRGHDHGTEDGSRPDEPRRGPPPSSQPPSAPGGGTHQH